MKSLYGTISLVLTNTLFAILMINMALFVAFAFRDSFLPDNFFGETDFVSEAGKNPVSQRHRMSLQGVYPDLKPEEIDQLLNETWGRSTRYEPLTVWKEAPFRGQFVNIESPGFRHSLVQAAWPPRLDRPILFIFGGSTTFGYGLPDNQTVPSKLAALLGTGAMKDAQVYNFGRSGYYSTQERALFEKLIAGGNIPDVAIFIDGLNEFAFDDDDELGTNIQRALDLQAKFPAGQTEVRLSQWGKDLYRLLPLSRAVEWFERRVLGIRPPFQPISLKQEVSPPSANCGSFPRNQRVIERYLRNKTMIGAVGEKFNIQTVFVWQPVPTYEYDLAYHPFMKESALGVHCHSQQGYTQFRQMLKTKPMSPQEFIWCADIQKNLKKPLYVDIVHYSSEMSGLVAECISQGLPTRRLP